MLSLMISVSVFCQTATFDDFELVPESYYTGAVDVDGFSSGGFYFENSYELYGQYVVWSGFAVSNFTESNFIISDYPNHQYCNVVGSGYDGSSNFAVVYPPFDGSAIVTMPEDNAMQITGTYVTNSPYATYSIINGDMNMGEPFTTGDWFKIVATGIDANRETKTAEIYLADYRSDNSEEHYIVDEWVWFDLSVLGEVVSIHFDLDASRKNDYGVLVPGYFCLDDFNGEENIGIIDYADLIDLTIYPNPTKDCINLYFNDEIDYNDITIRLLDISGRVLSDEKHTLFSKFISIDLKNYNNGIYFIEVQSNGRKQVKRLIKN